jgi:dipeptidyl aminopeptidase/acylaminoacyl peptidase
MLGEMVTLLSCFFTQDAIDETKIALMGHSFGGATVLQALSEDQRFR